MIEGTGNGDGTDLVVIDRRAGISWSKKMTIVLILARFARGELYSDVSTEV